MKNDDEKRKRAAFEHEKSDTGAAAQMEHKPYQSYSVVEYLKKVGINVDE